MQIIYMDGQCHSRYLHTGSIFGKTQENLRNRVGIELITDVCLMHKRVAKPTLLQTIFTVLQCTVQTLTLNRPVYQGRELCEGPQG